MATVKKPPEADRPDPDPFPSPPVPGGPRRASVGSAGDRLAMLALLAGASAFFLIGLGATDLWAPDEPRYAAIAEELRSGRHGARGLILLHLNDAPYDQKPPLYFWLAAAFGLPFGRVGEVEARLPSALAGVASVVGTFGIARLLRLPAAAAWLSAGLLATSFRFAFTARRAQLDVVLTACELTAIGLFLVLELRRGGIENARRSPGLLLALHAALGAAALVKGPVGWLPLLVFAVWLGWEGRLAAWRCLVPAWSWLVSIGPIALWIALATALAPDGFARGAVATNVFGRFFAGTSHARPFYYYAYQLPLDFLPWSLLGLVAVPAIVRACRAPRSDDGGRRAGARFLAAWSLTPLAFFTLSAGKRGLYLLPIFPALALASTFALPFESSAGGTTERARSRIRLLAGAIGVVAIGELAGALIALPRLDPEKSPRPIAESIARHAAPLEIVGIYRLRPLEGAIPYYGDRQVASLPSEEAALAFFASGGRLILLRADDFERRREGLNLESLARFRSARRELVLAQRAPLAAETEAPPSKAPAP